MNFSTIIVLAWLSIFLFGLLIIAVILIVSVYNDYLVKKKLEEYNKGLKK